MSSIKIKFRQKWERKTEIKEMSYVWRKEEIQKLEGYQGEKGN